METITIPLEEYNKLLAIQKKWDDLDAEIGEYYQYDDDGEPIEEDWMEDGLVGIGEKAAMAFGYL